jgi:hypothetical protein
MKQCTICGIQKPLFEFYKRPETKDGLRTDCKECFNSRSKKNWESKTKTERQLVNTKLRLKHQYGLTVEQFDKLVKEQNNKCFICDTEGGYNGKPLYVDHCHKSGQVRRLLCQHCNSGLGMFRDNPQLLLKAAEYLKEHNDGT